MSFLDQQPVAPERGQRVRQAGSRLRPELRMTELFRIWQTALKPSEQTAHEYQQSLNDFVEMLGDIPATDVTSDDLLDYRDAALNLPRSMPRAIAACLLQSG